MLTTAQLEILNKGLKFCPTPGEAQIRDLRRDLDKYHRSLRLKCHFKDDQIIATDGTSIGPFNDTSCLKLKSKSKYNFPMGSNNLETAITMNELGLQDSISPRPRKKNTEPDHLRAQKELSANTNIVIKPADKGGATVIQNRADYVAEGLRQLGDQVFYKPLDSDLTTEHNMKIIAHLDNMLKRGEITERVARFLVTEDIGDLRGDELLLTLDVSSLYTNIPNDEGTMATLRALRRTRPDGIQPSNLSLVEMLAQVLSYNNFQFEGKNYLQVGGTAMGTRVAPSYANIFMNDFEERHVYNYRLQPVTWYRYIDDIFCLWQHGEDELKKFTTHLNSVHETIKFTIEKSRTSVSFLDTEVHLDNNHLYTNLYVKPTDRNNYLPFDSAHPYHCKKGLPYWQFLRIRRICSRVEDFHRHCVNKAALLRQKGYPQSLIDEAYTKARDKMSYYIPKTAQNTT